MPDPDPTSEPTDPDAPERPDAPSVPSGLIAPTLVGMAVGVAVILLLLWLA